MLNQSENGFFLLIRVQIRALVCRWFYILPFSCSSRGLFSLNLWNVQIRDHVHTMLPLFIQTNSVLNTAESSVKSYFIRIKIQICAKKSSLAFKLICLKYI